MSTRQVGYIGGPADGHVDVLEAGTSRIWIPRPVRRIQTADGNWTPFVDGLSDSQLGARLLDAAYHRDDYSHAEWIVEDEVHGVYCARADRAGMAFVRLGQRQYMRTGRVEAAYLRLCVFLLREAAIHDGFPLLSGSLDEDLREEMSRLFPNDLALIARAERAWQRRLEGWEGDHF